MDVNFEYYKVFYYVAKYKNFTKAAHALGSGQPNVTRAMNCLEQQTHCTLFIRTNRGVQLTPEGEMLFTHVEAAISQIQTAETELNAHSGLEHGSISIGASETALNIYLLDILKPFHMKHPGIRLKIYNHSTRPFREILVGGKTFTALGSQELTLAELKNYPLICLGKETMTWNFYHKLFLSHGLELIPDTEAATTDQILPLVKAELGLAFLPEPMAKEALQQREIVQIHLRETIPERQICMVYDRKRPLSAAAQNLKTGILETMAF